MTNYFHIAFPFRGCRSIFVRLFDCANRERDEKRVRRGTAFTDELLFVSFLVKIDGPCVSAVRNGALGRVRKEMCFTFRNGRSPWTHSPHRYKSK